MMTKLILCIKNVFFFSNELEIDIREDFINKCISKRKKILIEKSSNDIRQNINPIQLYRIISFAILDIIPNNIKERFFSQMKVYYLMNCS